MEIFVESRRTFISEALKADTSLDAPMEGDEPEQPYLNGVNGVAPTLHDVLEDEEAICPKDAAAVAFRWKQGLRD